MARLRFFAHLRNDLEAVDVRHEQVGDDHVGTMLAKKGEATVAVVGLEHGPTLFLKVTAQGAAHDGIIVDQENGFHVVATAQVHAISQCHATHLNSKIKVKKSLSLIYRNNGQTAKGQPM